MCGIAGFVARRSLAPDSELTLAAMTGAIVHRGPDDAGHWFDAENGVALGHRRLSIIDLSPAGHQPMASASGRYMIVYNGEIYNFEELRRRLQGEGHATAWRGHSDTEVLLAAFEAWGVVAGLQQTNGMFALAVWDRQTRTLTLARDRLGEKPLYYGHAGERLVFASEIKPILQVPDFVRSVDREAAAAFMRLSYVPAPRTIWQGLFKLPAAHYREFDETGTAKGPPQPYWDAADMATSGDRAPFADDGTLDGRLEDLLKDAVALRMRADVPVGAFLSGGIDSSLVTALMQRTAPRPVRTFSIGFRETGYDEAVHARAVAQHLGTDHTELYVDKQAVTDVLARLPSIWDEPFGDSSQIPTYLVSALARRDVTIALSGDGGDELFGGYNRHVLGDRIWRKVHHLPHPVRRALQAGISAPSVATAMSGLSRLLPANRRPGALAERLPKIGWVVGARSLGDAYGRLISQWADEPVVVGAGAGALPLPAAAHFGDYRHAMMYMDMMTYLPDDILVKVDRAGMAVSLEGRVPLLDHRVVEFAWHTPLSAKIRNGVGKAILRDILYRYVPRTLIERPKAGFAAPIARWLSGTGALRDWAEALLDVQAIERVGLLDPLLVRAAWARYLAGDQAAFGRIWNSLMLQSWAMADEGCTAGSGTPMAIDRRAA